jgi:predicted MFS family arabinose efflux permease
MKPSISISISYFFLLGLLGAMGPYLTKELDGRSVGDLSLLLSMPALVGLFVTPIWGILADRFSYVRLWMALATLLIALGVSGLIYAQGTALYFFMFLYALGRAPLSPFLDAIALHVAKERYGSLRLWGSIGFMFVLSGCAFLDDFAGVSTLYVALILSVFLFVMVLRLPTAVQVPAENIFQSLPKLLRHRELLLLLVISALHFSSHAANTSYLAMYIESLHSSTLWTGAAIAGGIVVEVLVLAYSSSLHARWSSPQLFAYAAVIAFLRWIAMYFATSGLWVFLCQLSHGLSFGLFWIAVVPWVERLSPPDLKNTGQSLLGASVGGIGVGVGLYVATRVFEYSGLRDIYIYNISISLFTLFALAYLWFISSTNETPSS